MSRWESPCMAMIAILVLRAAAEYYGVSYYVVRSASLAYWAVDFVVDGLKNSRFRDDRGTVTTFFVQSFLGKYCLLSTVLYLGIFRRTRQDNRRTCDPHHELKQQPGSSVIICRGVLAITTSS